MNLNIGKPSELQDDIVNSSPSGSFSPSCVSSGEKQGKETAHDLQEKLDGDEVDRKSTKIVLSLGVEHDCAQTEQETNITENQRLCSNSGKGDENEGATEISAKSEEESETESEEEFENDNGIDRILTVQPAYRPSPGECSVLSCLSQFCVSELLDGNNKFACEVCTKRAQRNNKEEGSRKTKDNDKDDVSGDSSSEGKLTFFWLKNILTVLCDWVASVLNSGSRPPSCVVLLGKTLSSTLLFSAQEYEWILEALIRN